MTSGVALALTLMLATATIAAAPRSSDSARAALSTFLDTADALPPLPHGPPIVNMSAACRTAVLAIAHPDNKAQLQAVASWSKHVSDDGMWWQCMGTDPLASTDRFVYWSLLLASAANKTNDSASCGLRGAAARARRLGLGWTRQPTLAAGAAARLGRKFRQQVRRLVMVAVVVVVVLVLVLLLLLVLVLLLLLLLLLLTPSLLHQTAKLALGDDDDTPPKTLAMCLPSQCTKHDIVSGGLARAYAAALGHPFLYPVEAEASEWKSPSGGGALLLMVLLLMVVVVVVLLLLLLLCSCC